MQRKKKEKEKKKNLGRGMMSADSHGSDMLKGPAALSTERDASEQDEEQWRETGTHTLPPLTAKSQRCVRPWGPEAKGSGVRGQQ